MSRTSGKQSPEVRYAYEIPESSCDAFDNDCDNVIDEQVGGLCYGDPDCSGVLNCFDSFDNITGVGDGVCDIANGCSVVPGVCNNTGSDNGFSCDSNADCLTGVCEGVNCSGFVSCRNFGDATCALNSAFGCSPSGCIFSDARNAFNPNTYSGDVCFDTVGCDWTCGSYTPTEICSNGIDDDCDGFVDCQDSDCQVPDFVGVSGSDVDRFVCLGTDVYSGDVDLSGDFDGDGDPIEWQCSVGLDDAVGTVVPSVGLCCSEGYYPLMSDLGVWTCVATSPCLAVISPLGECDFVYSVASFVDWFNDVGCLDSSAPLACCSVVQFGNLEYWSDEGNVVVY